MQGYWAVFARRLTERCGVKRTRAGVVANDTVTSCLGLMY
jgi:hypothetical protein